MRDDQNFYCGTRLRPFFLNVSILLPSIRRFVFPSFQSLTSRSIVKLTSKGKVAYYAHKHWHETMDGGFKDYFMALGEEKVDFLLDFIDKAEDFIKRAVQ